MDQAFNSGPPFPENSQKETERFCFIAVVVGVRDTQHSTNGSVRYTRSKVQPLSWGTAKTLEKKEN